MPLMLVEETDGFVLARSGPNPEQFRLTEDDILTLAQSLPVLRDRVLAKHSPKGDSVSAVSMTTVAQIALNTDIHKTEIHLQMIDQNGARLGFALPPEVARPLSQRLPIRLAEIDAAAKGRVRQ